MKEKQEEAETGDGLVSNIVNQGRMITFRGEMMAIEIKIFIIFIVLLFNLKTVLLFHIISF